MASKNRRGSKIGPSKFDRRIRRIARGYERRVAAGQSEAFKTPATSAAGHLREATYRLGRKLKNGELASPSGGSFAASPFSFILTAVLAQVGEITKPIRNRIRLMARELDYADERNVPPKYLIGFIHQVGGSKWIQKQHAAQSANALPLATNSASARERHSNGADTGRMTKPKRNPRRSGASARRQSWSRRSRSNRTRRPRY